MDCLTVAHNFHEKEFPRLIMGLVLKGEIQTGLLQMLLSTCVRIVSFQEGRGGGRGRGGGTPSYKKGIQAYQGQKISFDD